MQPGYLNRYSLDLKQNHNGASSDGIASVHDFCAVEEIHQLAHPQKAYHKANHLFELVFTDLAGTITLKALTGYMFVSKISKQHLRWA